MNLRMLGIFMRNKIEATPVSYASAPNASGEWVNTPTYGTAIEGVKYQQSAAKRYFQQSWNSDVTDVFVTYDIGTVTLKSQLQIDSTVYAIDSIDNVELQGDVYLIGLKVQK